MAIILSTICNGPLGEADINYTGAFKMYTLTGQNDNLKLHIKTIFRAKHA